MQDGSRRHLAFWVDGIFGHVIQLIVHILIPRNLSYRASKSADGLLQ